jgi:N-acetylglucosaminyldiphosphoundecaprenol N-acetyl-beta-D-mannosaminyltransferase
LTDVASTKLSFLGIAIDDLTSEDLVAAVSESVRQRRQTRIYNVNVNAMNIARADERFARSLNEAEVVFCDGYGVKLGARLLGVRISHRLTHMDWIDLMFAQLERDGRSVFLLGGKRVVTRACALRISERYPNLRIAGWHHGFFEKEGAASDAVVRLVNTTEADVLMVGFGMPLQEFWLDANREALSAPVLMSVGALFEWYSGAERRAPSWMSQRGVEWLWRLMHHPVRLFPRYVIGNLAFGVTLLRRWIAGGW